MVVLKANEMQEQMLINVDFFYENHKNTVDIS